MNNQKALEMITNSFIAAGKIRELKKSKKTRNEDNEKKLNDIQTLFKMLQVLSDYSPEKYRQPLARTVDRSRLYMETYHNLRQHISNLEKPKPKSRNFINTLNVVKPVLGKKEALITDKIIKLYELLNNRL